MNIQDKVVAITGGARGLGFAIAQALAEKGAKICLMDMNADLLEEAKASLGSDHDAIICNVSDESSVTLAFSEIEKRFGQLDILVNNAGILRDGLLLKVKEGQIVDEMSLQTWQSVIDVNLTGVFLCGREGAKIMVNSERPGCIINISSIARAGNVGQSNYSAAKAGVAALTTTWAKELARYQIRSMAIAPGFIETDMTGSMKPEAQAHMAKVIPLGHAGQPHHIAQTAISIIENDYLSGRVIEIDGGLRI